MIDSLESYVYKKEVDWSLLYEGVAIPIDIQMIFKRNMGKFLKRGEAKRIYLYLDGKPYNAQIRSINYNRSKYGDRKDIVQIRYTPNGELARQLQKKFIKSYQYILLRRQMRKRGDHSIIRLSEDCREYLAIYTTSYEDSYILDTIAADDISELKEVVKDEPERVMEARFNYDTTDLSAGILETQRIVKIRKLNKKIGDNLKLLYDYRCQICGKVIGEEYGTHVAEAHHIDYFVKSINNDSKNQMIVCPNHHSIIHDTNPIFDRKRLLYIYPNGYEEELMLNKYL